MSDLGLACADPFPRHRDAWPAELYAEILAGLRCQPLFQFVMSTDTSGPAIERVRATLCSLSRQRYRGWRLALVLRHQPFAFDELTERLASGTDTVSGFRQGLVEAPFDLEGLRRRLVENLDDIGDRVSLCSRGGKQRICDVGAPPGASATGPVFFAVLRAGDQLRSDCLAELATESGLHRDTEFFYSDEERLDGMTQRIGLFFKPEWSPDLLLSTNYIGRLWCGSAALLGRIGATVEELLRLGEYDLVLRCTEEARGIRHIKGALCRRWGDALDTPASEKRALVGALRRRGIEGEVAPGHVAGTYRIKRRLQSAPLVSIIIPTRAARGLIKKCIESLRSFLSYRKFEIIAIDNIPATDCASKSWLRANVNKVVEVDEKFNWSRFNNTGARHASGDILLFLNDDIEAIDADWLEALAAVAERPEVGVVGPQLLYPDERVQHAGMFLAGLAHGRHAFRHRKRDDPGYFGLALTQRNVSAVTGACLMTRREVFSRVGGFEEAHDITNNDLDYCLKIRNVGLLCVYTPHITLIHHERGTREQALDHYDHALFESRWSSLCSRGDPYHHPGLSTDIDDLAIEVEPVEVVSLAGPLFKRESIERILIVKLDHLGDCVGAIPAIRRLAQVFPQARLSVLSGSWAAPIWSRVPEINRIINVDFFDANPEAPPLRLTTALLEVLRRRLEPAKYDIAVDLRQYPETRAILRYAGARHTVGFDVDGRFPWLDLALDWQSDIAGRPMRQNVGDPLIGLVDAIAAACQPHSPTLYRRTSKPRGRATAWPKEIFARRVVCIHAGADSPVKRWPPSHFAELINRLVEEQDVNIALIGAVCDITATAAVLAKVTERSRVWSLAGEVAADDLPDFIDRCALFVGNDSGSGHIAAALGVPTIGIHGGDEDVREGSPAGPHVIAIRRKHRKLACLTGLRPLDVYPVCERLLAIGYNRPLSGASRHRVVRSLS